MSIAQHPLLTEYRDRRGRRWCRTCGLPETNARAVAAHTLAPSTGDWRDQAWLAERPDSRAA